MCQEKSKRLKVSGQLRSSDRSSVPLIKLSGKWVAELGFKQGDQIVVTMREGLMIIERMGDKAILNELTYKAVLKKVLRELQEIRKI